MNARTPHPSLATEISHAHLDDLEAETIDILREVVASFERPALLFSGGKDSLVMLRCAEKAFGAGRLPFPLLMSTPAITSPRSRNSETIVPRNWVPTLLSDRLRTQSPEAPCD